jgi:hypothetical protein
VGHRRHSRRVRAGFNKDRDNQNEGYIDLKFAAGDPSVHWDPDAWQQRNDESRPALIVNQCPQFVRQVTGDIRQMRPAIKVMPVDDMASKDMAAKELPALIRYVERRSDAAGIYFAAADQAVGGRHRALDGDARVRVATHVSARDRIVPIPTASPSCGIPTRCCSIAPTPTLCSCPGT